MLMGCGVRLRVGCGRMSFWLTGDRAGELTIGRVNFRLADFVATSCVRTYANLEGLNETAWFEPIPGNETFEVLRFRA